MMTSETEKNMAAQAEAGSRGGSAPEDCKDQWKFALESVGDGIWEWSVPDNRLHFSPRCKEMLGYAENELGDSVQDWEALVHPDDLARCHEDFQRHLDGEAAMYQNEHRLRTKNAGYRWFLDRGKISCRGQDGRPLRVVGTHTDIHDRKEAERALLAERAHYRNVIETMVDGLIVIDAQGIIQSVNSSAERIFGYSAAELAGQSINRLMPEPYRSSHDGHMRRYLETGEARVIGYGREVAGLRKDGATFPISLAVGEMAIDGKRYFTGIIRDVTKRKRSEEALLIAASVYRAMGEAVLVTDADNNIITVNESFTRLTGYELFDLVGKNPKVLASGRQNAAFYQKMWQSLQAEGRWQGQIWNLRKNGEVYLESLSISIIYDDNGDVLRHVAVFSEVENAAEAA